MRLLRQNKTLDMRYHEMWNDWDGVDEPADRGPFLCDTPKSDKLPHNGVSAEPAVRAASKMNGTATAHRAPQLVLSWKRLNVSVKQTVQKFFKPSVTTYKQILHNGESCGSTSPHPTHSRTPDGHVRLA